jgi:hypothetical protein
MQSLIAAELDREMLYQEAVSRDYHLVDSVVKQRLIRNMRFLQLGEGENDEAVYQQALKLELHLGDEVVKRRLQQLMETVLLSSAVIEPPSEASIQALFESRREELRIPARYSFQHVYLPQQRMAEAQPLLDKLLANGFDPLQARQFSAPFLPGLSFRGHSPDQIARNFGAKFSTALVSLEPKTEQWMGPVPSVYGVHLVWIEEYVSDRDAELAEVRDRLVRDLEEENRRLVLAEQIDLLRSGYEVVL